jgi:hypothetical protein
MHAIDRQTLPGQFQPNQPQADPVYWAKMPEWTVEEAAAILCGFNPAFVDELDMATLLEYNGLLELALRAANSRDFGYPYTPALWLNWAKKIDRQVPPELEAAVAKYHQQPAPLSDGSDKSDHANEKAKRGPKFKWDWESLQAEAFELLDYHGDFDAADPEWNSQSCLERALLELHGEPAPAESTLRQYVVKWVAAWRKAKADN